MNKLLKMFNKTKYTLLLVPGIVLISLAFCFKKKANNDTILSQAILTVLDKVHYQPQEINDAFSEKLFNLYLKRLDNNKRFFLQSDIDKLEMYKTRLDDDAKKDNYDFFNAVNSTYQQRLDVIEKWYLEILNKPFNFNENEYLEYNEDKAKFLSSDEQLREFWRKSLKQQVLEKLYQKQTAQEKAIARKDTVFKIKPIDSLELLARMEVKKVHVDWFKRLRNFDKKDQLSLYINCITELFDPHTNYFPPKDKENFDIRMSGQLEGIGAQLQEKDGQLKVVSIVPGSPSYKQGQLKAGDIILKVAQGTNEPVDVSNMKIDDAIKLIRGKKGTEVRLSVRKPDETLLVIPIIRDVVQLEEGFAKSSIIQYNGKPYGYIYLPSFYLDMNNSGGHSSSVDIATEIEKLKNDNVKGILLDLRNNGGGSLQDVVEIGGYFIERGPITQIKDRNSRTDVLADKDNSVLFDAPLAIMVNENSASASEILAAAMQDYGRAVIIGTTTFGKGTVQRFVPLDEAFNTPDNDPLGALKVTIQKFYRINGGTTQLAGVTPDIIIPDKYRYLEYGEKDSEHPLGVDKIKKSDYKTDLDYSKSIATAIKNSKKRIEESALFNEIERFAVKIKEQKNKSKFTLNYKEYKEEQQRLEEDNKTYEELLKKVEKTTITNTTTDANLLQSDTLKLKIKNDWNKGFEKDIYIQESVKVLSELKR